jgi:hypothetical protein
MGKGETGVTSVKVERHRRVSPGNGQVVDPAWAVRPGPHVMATSDSRLQQPRSVAKTQHLKQLVHPRIMNPPPILVTIV